MANLDQSLTQLAEILRKIGVEELVIAEDAQHHVINNHTAADFGAIDKFCTKVQEMYDELVAGEEG